MIKSEYSETNYQIISMNKTENTITRTHNKILINIQCDNEYTGKNIWVGLTHSLSLCFVREIRFYYSN